MKQKIIKIVTAIMITLICSLLIMLLWNYTITVIFGLTEISFLQALALKLLSHYLITNELIK
ncbi:hypothetical protein UFOVP756_18 [uncultured Caudovirales phage]|jgi:hypothetical protein|uniref:Uncharacterized protein n=1 Tax=uncultured Caudovirales phage TaxID=2100421 RepID=A0A6J7X4Y2_9CAUD|nr:hypothetical protein UFOVP756_18 [uncultured Caudovirales phage]